MDVKRAADLYAQGWSLRQIGAELGVSQMHVSRLLRRALAKLRDTAATDGSTSRLR